MEHIFRQWIGMHRAMIAWFHAAHHVTKGTGFGGDHVNIYGEIYTTLDEDLDQIVEKGIGLTGDESLADPVSSLSMAAGLLAQQPASANQDAETIAGRAGSGQGRQRTVKVRVGEGPGKAGQARRPAPLPPDWRALRGRRGGV